MTDARLLPYAFARDFGLLAQRNEDGVEVWVSETTAPAAPSAPSGGGPGPVIAPRPRQQKGKSKKKK